MDSIPSSSLIKSSSLAAYPIRSLLKVLSSPKVIRVCKLRPCENYTAQDLSLLFEGLVGNEYIYRAERNYPDTRPTYFLSVLSGYNYGTGVFLRIFGAFTRLLLLPYRHWNCCSGERYSLC